MAGTSSTRPRQVVVGFRFRLQTCAALLACAIVTTDGVLAAGTAGDEWTLEELVAVALDRNANLSAAQSTSDAAREGIAVARGARMPRLDAVGLGEIFPRRERLLIFRHGFRKEDNPFENGIVNYGLEFTLPLYTSGRVEHGIKLAVAQAEAARFRVDVTRNVLIFNIASTYYTALRLKDVISAQEAALASLQESLRVAGLQREVGRISPLDMLRIVTRESEGEGELVGARTAYDQAIELLKELIAVPPEVFIDIAGELIQASVSAVHVESLRQRALDDRPDLVALRHEVRARREAVRVTESRFRPTVDLNLQDAERRALTDIQRAVLDLNAAGPRIEAAGRAVQQAEEGLRIEREKFAQGRGTSNDLLLAEEALLRARTKLAAFLSDSQIALAELKLAIGEDAVALSASSALSLVGD